MDPFRLEQSAQKVLDPGETLVWCGSPDPQRTAIAALPMAVFGIPFGGFAAFWMITASRITSSGPRVVAGFQWLPLFGVPFLLIGLAMLCAPVWTFLGARGTIYGITNRRVFIAGGNGKAVRSFARNDIGDLEHTERSDGSGDLYFGLRRVHARGNVEVKTRIGFIGIRDVRHVEATLREQLESEAA